MKEILVGSSSFMEKLRAQVIHAAASGLNVVIYGENGVGKELTARSIYRESSRQGRPFVKIDCAALQEKMLESRLFEHENGFFTGSESSKCAKHKMSKGCVLFLDKIAAMPLSIQHEIFRVLQNDNLWPPEFKRSKLAGPLVLSTAAHILEPDVQAGKFNEKLYRLINGIPIYIPPLRNRAEEIPALIDYYLKKYAIQFQNNLQLQPDMTVMQKLMRYQWPENINELQDVVQRFLILGDWESVVENLPSDSSKTAPRFNTVN
jgi:DNA-binding NtrC family response regulator